jgi:hypothetical protein
VRHRRIAKASGADRQEKQSTALAVIACELHCRLIPTLVHEDFLHDEELLNHAFDCHSQTGAENQLHFIAATRPPGIGGISGTSVSASSKAARDARFAR